MATFKGTAGKDLLVGGAAADSMFGQSIVCSDGWLCESVAIGQARRQPAFEQEDV